jgi:ech hydrogenase subunit F
MAFFTMAKTSLANLFKKPATLMYPTRPRNFYDATRGHIMIDTCIFCGICQKKCPTGAIAVGRKEKTWSIERLRCIACASCCEACPKNCLTMMNTYSPPAAVQEKETTVQTYKGTPANAE